MIILILIKTFGIRNLLLYHIMGCAYSLPDNLRDEIIEAKHAQERDTERYQPVVIKEPDNVTQRNQSHKTLHYSWS
jgi:hypothetical protein